MFRSQVKVTVHLAREPWVREQEIGVGSAGITDGLASAVTMLGGMVAEREDVLSVMVRVDVLQQKGEA